MAPDLYMQHLSALITSQKADPVIRDYASQHLALWVSGNEPQDTEPPPAQISSAFETLLKEAANPDNAQLTLPGTVMNALTHAVLNGSKLTDAHRAALTQQAIDILENPNFSNVNRATAIQAAARLHAPELTERCRRLAQDTQAPADLRLSAIAALGLVGGTEDRALLQSFASDESYRFAAAAAVERVDQRSHTP
jgi:hypothetical protein